jgi:hypothetical protein
MSVKSNRPFASSSLAGFNNDAKEQFFSVPLW